MRFSFDEQNPSFGKMQKDQLWSSAATRGPIEFHSMFRNFSGAGVRGL